MRDPFTLHGERQAGVLFNLLRDVHFPCSEPIARPRSLKYDARRISQREVGAYQGLQFLNQPEVLDAKVQRKTGVVVAGKNGGRIMARDEAVRDRVLNSSTP